MTLQEEKYIRECEWTLAMLVGACSGWPAGPKSILVNTMTEHIQKMKNLVSGPRAKATGNGEFIIGLTFSDLMQLQNGGTIQVNPKDVGLLDLPITLLLGGTDEHMAQGLAKHPHVISKITESHGDTKN